jgi:cytochrome P450
MRPAYNRHYNLVFGYLATKLAKAREKAQVLGESAVEMADNTLDMMVAREARGDTMSDAEMKDEIFLCELASSFCE